MRRNPYNETNSGFYYPPPFATIRSIRWGERWGVGVAKHKLSPRAVATLSTPGRHSDGEGLYLVVDKAGSKRWVFLFRWDGKLKEMGLGGLSKVSQSKARQAAVAARSLLGEGVNPIDARREESAVPDFGTWADDWVAEHASSWRNAKHRAQWETTFKGPCKPLRALSVDKISTDDVLTVLKPLWTSTPETASRVRGRIERVLDAAKAKGHRSGENPARWRGHLDHLLPKRQRLSRGHHLALPYAEVPAFMGDLRERESVSATALEFTVLTAARSGEVMGATWAEFDLSTATWTVPAERMKAGKEHRVPLSPPVLAILERAAEFRDAVGSEAFVFPGAKRGKPLSNMAMAMVLRRMGRTDITVHGFRSTFRDWVGERTAFPREVAEAALAHTVGDATERAYRRGDALEKRRKLMEAWAGFARSAPTGNVIPLARGRSSPSSLA